jgi:predicted nucleic acid-binding protein
LNPYLDTSVVVAALTNEAATPRIKAWLAAHSDTQIAVSDWVITEVSSALSIKLRLRTIDAAYRAHALGIFKRWCGGVFTVMTVSPTEFRIAATFADQHELGLRGGDALHAAICLQHGATLFTLDSGQCRAARTLGIAAELL